MAYNAHQFAHIECIIISMHRMTADARHTPAERISWNFTSYKSVYKPMSSLYCLSFNHLAAWIHLISDKFKANSHKRNAPIEQSLSRRLTKIMFFILFLLWVELALKMNLSENILRYLSLRFDKMGFRWLLNVF